MAIGTAAAIGLGATALGGVLSAKSQKKAAGKAADVSQQVANDNNALARDMYSQNAARLDPYGARGNAAGGQINALLGLGGQPQQQLGAPGSTFGGANQTMFDMGGAQSAQNAAFDNFRNSTGYQNRLQEGYNALNSGWAGAGMLQSGAAGQAFVDYGQQQASNEFGNYTNLLAQQQQMGLSGASALAGVGQNMVGQVSYNNNANGSNQANAALVRGANNPFANALGMAGGGLMGGILK